MANETKIASLGAAADAEAEAGPLSMVDEALVAGNIANTNGLLVIVAKLVAKGIFDEEDLQAFSDSYSKPLDHEHMRANELVSQMQDQMEETLAQLMRFLAERP
jgi:SOS response regulatory protein OraA/RecX